MDSLPKKNHSFFHYSQKKIIFRCQRIKGTFCLCNLRKDEACAEWVMMKLELEILIHCQLWIYLIYWNVLIDQVEEVLDLKMKGYNGRKFFETTFFEIWVGNKLFVPFFKLGLSNQVPFTLETNFSFLCSVV